MTLSNGTSERRHAGFTLVEVIVVLVILAILAAIAIPALTGYIDKAREKQYIADARNAAMAIRAAIDEAYADGTLNIGTVNDNFLVDGNPTTTAYINFKRYRVNSLGYYNSSETNEYLYFQRAAELMGTTFPVQAGGALATPGLWGIDFYAPKASDYTLINAPAWAYSYWPEGYSVGAPVLFITYGIGGIPKDTGTYAEVVDKFKADGVYDPNAGYIVFDFM
jgi:prepilin-type N-terminal cleavage/methylation domain-containing protein